MKANNLLKNNNAKVLLNHLKGLEEPFYFNCPIISGNTFLLWSLFVNCGIITKINKFQYILNSEYK